MRAHGVIGLPDALLAGSFSFDDFCLRFLPVGFQQYDVRTVHSDFDGIAGNESLANIAGTESDTRAPRRVDHIGDLDGEERPSMRSAIDESFVCGDTDEFPRLEVAGFCADQRHCERQYQCKREQGFSHNSFFKAEALRLTL
jgi:hypothetical protein